MNNRLPSIFRISKFRLLLSICTLVGCCHMRAKNSVLYSPILISSHQKNYYYSYYCSSSFFFFASYENTAQNHFFETFCTHNFLRLLLHKPKSVTFLKTIWILLVPSNSSTVLCSDTSNTRHKLLY